MSNIKKIVTGVLLLLTLGILLAACGSTTNTPSNITAPNASVTSGVTTSASTTTALAGGANMTPQSTFTSSANGTPSTSAATSTAGTARTATTASSSTTGTAGTGSTTTTSVANSTSAVSTTAPVSTTSTNATVAGIPNATVGGGLNVVQQDTGILVINGANAFSVSPTFERSVIVPFASAILGSPNTTSPIRYKVYTSTQSGDQILSYYDSEMTKLGLTKVTTQQTPTLPNVAVTSKLAAYTKGSNDPVAGVVTIGPMTSQLITVLGAIDPAITTNVKAGDTVIMLLNDGLTPSTRS